jgi:hypothetical protein
MTREVPTTGTHVQAEVCIIEEAGLRTAVQLIVALMMFIVLAGIWACLWVPLSFGF